MYIVILFSFSNSQMLPLYLITINFGPPNLILIIYIFAKYVFMYNFNFSFLMNNFVYF